MALALGLIILPAVSWAVPAPFNSFTSHPASLSVVNFLGVNVSGPTAYDASTDATYTSDVAAQSPKNVFSGTLNLTNNDIIIVPTIQDSAHGLAAYQAAYDMIRSGADQGAYDGTGVSSSTVATDAGVKGALALGIMYNDDTFLGGSGSPVWGATSGANVSDNGPFDGYSNLSQFDTIIKYTFIGDTDLEGQVSQNLVAPIFSNLGKTLVQFPNNSPSTTLFQAGDFYYQVSTGAAPINQSDYSQAFTNLSLQHTGYPYGGAGVSASSLSVPEPTSLVLVVMGVIAVLLFGFRKQRRGNRATA
ncbi:MAG TPA: PEP-CTERM sorting domain-containing protein [Pirellulales bacterium]|nr:PEP-CTERM sorting domain-containing protein [Pirellulales bacterium]